MAADFAMTPEPAEFPEPDGALGAGLFELAEFPEPDEATAPASEPPSLAFASRGSGVENARDAKKTVVRVWENLFVNE